MRKMFVFAVVMLISLSLVACDGQSPNPTEVIPSDIEEPTEEIAPEQAPQSESDEPKPICEMESETEPEEPAEVDPEIEMWLTIFEEGDTVTIDDWEVTLNSFEFKNQVRGSRGYFSPQDGNSFLYVTLTIENLGNVPGVFNPRVAYIKTLTEKLSAIENN